MYRWFTSPALGCPRFNRPFVRHKVPFKHGFFRLVVVTVVGMLLLFVDGAVVIAPARCVFHVVRGPKKCTRRHVTPRLNCVLLSLFLSLQVEETMKNPEFMKEMKSMMETPEMKAALGQVILRLFVACARSFVNITLPITPQCSESGMLMFCAEHSFVSLAFLP